MIYYRKLKDVPGSFTHAFSNCCTRKHVREVFAHLGKWRENDVLDQEAIVNVTKILSRTRNSVLMSCSEA